MSKYEVVIGLETHIQLNTTTKIFCGCKADSWFDPPNTNICPVCTGLPGVLPVLNQAVVARAVLLAAAMHAEIRPVSYFDRKNYFYPDLPKGYQISQYEEPLARQGKLAIRTPGGEQVVRVRRVHLEEDTGKLTHVDENGHGYSLVDLNRAGVPLLEIVSEPDMHSIEAVRTYATGLRALLRYLAVNSGDMEKGVIRFEANVSLRLKGSQTLGTRVEIKNLNSFRAMERAITYEIKRQGELLQRGQAVVQQTLGWDEAAGATFTQRSKEEANDYRYFPEPDLPPLVVEPEWVERIRAGLPELPAARRQRFERAYGLSGYDAGQLTADQAVADYFERVLAGANNIPPKQVANWMLGELFGILNQRGSGLESLPVPPEALAELLAVLAQGEINTTTAKVVLAEMAHSGQRAAEIIRARGLRLVSDTGSIAALVSRVLDEHPNEVAGFLAGKQTLAQWFFGQVMKLAGGQADPQVVRAELERQLQMLKN